MATLKALMGTYRSRPILTTAAGLAVLGTAYYTTQRQPLWLDSAYKELTPALSFPKNMLFSQELKVTKVEQINHDTKRITFALPGGSSQISGLVPGG